MSLFQPTRDEARHGAMECLAERIWQAQRHGAPYDNEAYLACLRRQAD